MPHTFALRDSNSVTRSVGGMRWIALYLFVHSLLTLLPTELWKRLENNIIRNLMLNEKPKLMDTVEWVSKRTKIITYLRYRFGKNQWYGVGFVLVEIVQFVISIFHYFAMETYLRYPLYGLQATNVIEPLFKAPGVSTSASIVFPEIAKCQLPVTGNSGNTGRMITQLEIVLKEIKY